MHHLATWHTMVESIDMPPLPRFGGLLTSVPMEPDGGKESVRNRRGDMF